MKTRVFLAGMLGAFGASAWATPLLLAPQDLMTSFTVNGVAVDPARSGGALTVHARLGIMGSAALRGDVIHRTDTRILETRGLKTPKGDYLVMFPEGDHYANGKGRRKDNMLLAYRSTDGGKTWRGPHEAFDVDYSLHGFIPFVPKGSSRIYAFGTQPNPDAGYDWTGGRQENAPIGYRYSDDDGKTWSSVTLIRPVNDPEFKGMAVMRMTETDAGTWLLGAHTADWSVKPLTTRQYLLRSEDKGETWEVLPRARPDGWTVMPYRRMDEGRPLALGGGSAILMARTPAGSLFIARSADDGKTWSDFAPSPLVHPGAPPMLFPLSDGKTLLSLHHNRIPTNPNEKRADGLSAHSENMKVRSEIWVSLSRDGGRTWSEPRFLFVNAVKPNRPVAAWNYQCSYVDAFCDGRTLHLFVPHRWEQVLHLTIAEDELTRLPTKGELRTMAPASQQ